jgi:phytol kinase
MILCGGDGLADLVGRRYGRRKLPHNPEKSWAGSGAMFAGGFVLAAAMTAVFQRAGLIAAAPGAGTFATIAVIALACAVVESFRWHDVDNLTISATAIALGLALW